MDITHIYRTHAAPLYRYLVHLTGDEEIASDILHDTFLQLVKVRPEERALRAWLYRVATNGANGHWRSTKRRRRLLERMPGDVLQSDPPAGPDARLLRQERRSSVQVALATLAARDRIALLMREEGFSHAEIAEAIGTTTKSVGTVLVRALDRLRDALSESEEAR